MIEEQPAVIVKDLYKSFKLPHEQHSGIKQLLVNFAKRKKGYEVQHVLDDISFEIKKGEFFGIVGRNGSGKSTLLKLLAGIYAPDRGLVQVNGSLTPFIELGVGFNAELTGRENVFMNGALLGFSKSEMESMYSDIVEFAELERFMDQKLKNYSSGMQVRLAFSIAIRAKSDVLLIDEVLAVGDSAFQQKCFDYFEKLKNEKQTIILVTHDMSAVKRFCSSAVYIKDGKIVEYGDPFDIADLYTEGNIAETETKDDQPELSAKSKLHATKRESSKDRVVIDFSYDSEENEDMYLGISILKNGISLAELTTGRDKPLHGNSKISYVLDTNNYNEGVYQVSSALFRMQNRELIAICKDKVTFRVEGFDITRGGALKLPDNWEYN